MGVDPVTPLAEAEPFGGRPLHAAGGPPPPPPNTFKFDTWAGVAKVIHTKLKESPPSIGDWPCLKAYLTGTCGLTGCNVCAKGKTHGSAAARAVCKTALATLAPRMSDALRATVKAGDRARATADAAAAERSSAERPRA